jgi:hypothetical protein
MPREMVQELRGAHGDLSFEQLAKEGRDSLKRVSISWGRQYHARIRLKSAHSGRK